VLSWFKIRNFFSLATELKKDLPKQP